MATAETIKQNKEGGLIFSNDREDWVCLTKMVYINDIKFGEDWWNYSRTRLELVMEQWQGRRFRSRPSMPAGRG